VNYKEYLENVVIPVAEELEKKNKEIERLKEVINGMIDNEEKYNLEIIKLKSIIKEVREYIKNIPDDEFVESEHFTELLEILDKENK
jgi:hypothetical protein